ncbi:zinc ribbon domain-containing protein [Vulcanisaeta sp. JCM 16161]|uniref:Zn-ribbon domain-containing OB-fold protein n=1 Tax=Vulcanisaeta sp. JCM 16161 TaxID=1295372 RepID=UPI001FB32A5B|nr:zinc ribbon domain-containing protein [Vulcanisaeta sp. JCM 16161]
MAEKKPSRKTVKAEGPTIDSVPIVYRHKIPIGKTVKYWDGLKEGRIYATRCKSCGAVYYPPQADCPYCGSSDVEWIELLGRASLRPSPGFTQDLRVMRTLNPT